MYNGEVKRVAIIENSPLLARYFRPFVESGGGACETYPVWRGAAFPRGAFSAYILTGDFHNITDGLKPYHEAELEFLLRIEGARLFASCFSHQLVAHQRGGKIERRQPRLLGWEMVRVTEEHPALGGLSSFPALNMNTDEVTEPPTGGRALAGSENCRYQLLAYGGDVLTCQAHPELGFTRGRAAVNALVFLLAGGYTQAYRDYRESRSIADDSACLRFMQSVVRWLLE